MTEPGQSESCKFATRDNVYCIPLTARCLFREGPSGCSKYQPPADLVQIPGTRWEGKGWFWRGMDGYWYLGSQSQVTALHELYKAFGDEPVKLTIEKVRA